MLTNQNIESELSYAYLHAVAAMGGFGCEISGRHLDSAGVDATISEDGRKLADGSVFTSFNIHVQLKATVKEPIEQDGRYSYSLTVPHYDKLRNPKVKSQRFLVVLYLPPNHAEWLTHNEECLIARRCAYWVSLRNAPESSNSKHQTVYIPRTNVLSAGALSELMTIASCNEEINYVP